MRVDDLKLKAEHGFEAMCDSLALDKPQKRQARRLFDDMLDKKRELIRILQNGYLDIDLLCEKVTRINRDYFERLSGLLNEQQKQKFIRLRETWLEPCR
ncbi:MAG: hypothetical protein JXQ83_03060 [Candidatus Glassbacteria bacterium]|nr:hypothetical protein [Candidatus Glassbacteria bacterium]